MKTNEELFDEWWASVIFDLEPTEFKVKKAFLAACEIKDKELNQQRFNNQHNLSIDQTVADKIEGLEKELEKAHEVIKELYDFLEFIRMQNPVSIYANNLIKVHGDYLKQLEQG